MKEDKSRVTWYAATDSDECDYLLQKRLMKVR